MTKKKQEEQSVKEQAKAFAKLPKAERRKLYQTLPYEVQMEARRLVEQGRGIRHVNGKLEFTTQALKERIERLKAKRQKWSEGIPKLDALIAEHEEELADRNEE